ncbi:hypothetical protein ACFRKE_00680 [Kitasatospora indigofera]|uniref:hypothetical protein n=1 Tax=Kitasatospora indigofera TaxID=67307 RepID=UPI00367E6232
MSLPRIPAPLARAAARSAAARAAGLRISRTVGAWIAVYWPGRRTVLMTAGMTIIFLLGGASAAEAADGDESGGLLAPLNVLSSEGVPLDSYDLKSENGGATDIRSHVCNLLLGAGFALVRMLVGLMCWVCQWIWTLPVVSTLTETAHKLSSQFFVTVGSDLELYSLFLAAGVAFGCILMMRGKVARGAGEMVITLLLSTLVMLPALTPRSVLGEQGPLMQSQAAAHEVGQLAANVNGPDPGCTSEKDLRDPSCPMRMILTRTLVVQPYQLLQYGVLTDPKSENPRIRELAGVHDTWIHGGYKGKEKDCGIDWLPGGDVCPHQTGWDQLKEELKKHGKEGMNAYNFAVDSNWDRVGGTVLVLFAALLIAIVVLGMALVHLGCQFADVVAASVTAPALIWAMLPGGNRSALWKWLGIFMTSIVTEFAVSIMLPLFALGASSILNSPEKTFMIQRLLILDAFALVILVFHRRVFAAAGQVGDRFANRMRYAKVGGSIFLGENQGLALAMSQAMGTLSSPGGGLGSAGSGAGMLGGGLLGGGGSGAHSALMRKARIAQGLAAIADPGLGRMNAGAMAAGAYGEVRRGLSALALPLHAAHQLVAGSPLPQHKLARRLKPVGSRGPLGGHHPQAGPGGPGAHGGPAGGRGPAGGHGPAGGGRPPFGRQQQMPAHGLTPAGHALHNALLGTRAGRLAIRAGQMGKLGFNATLGAPATWTRINRANDAMWESVDHQWAHYSNVRREWAGDWAEGAKDLTKEIPAGVRAAKSGVQGTYNIVQGAAQRQYYQAAAYGPPLVNGFRTAYDLSVGAPFTAPSGRASHHDPTAHGQVWEHARDRGPEYPFYELPEASESVLGDGSVVRSAGGEGGDGGPADLWSALGPGVVAPSEPVVVVQDEEGLVVNGLTGEILSSWPAADGMDPGALRRVSPEVLREPGSASPAPPETARPSGVWVSPERSYEQSSPAIQAQFPADHPFWNFAADRTFHDSTPARAAEEVVDDDLFPWGGLFGGDGP